MLMPRFQLSGVLLAVCCLALVAETLTTEAQAGRKRPITKLQFDPDAEKVDFFDGVKDKKFSVQIIPKNAMGGSVLIENLTKKPLTVKLPDAVVGVQVLQQFGAGGGGAGGFGGGCGGMGGGMGGMGGGMGGGGQMMGGGMMGGMGGGMMGGMGGGMGGMGGMGGGGFFSIPPEKIVKVPYTSVCLEHGKVEPHPRHTYRFFPVEDCVEDPAVQELIRIVATGKVNKQAAQAAAWHLANKMSWQELAAKHVDLLAGGGRLPYFSRAELVGAQNLVSISVARAKERAKNPEVPKPSDGQLEPAPRTGQVP